ncbi:uncharacterized protein LOC108864464 [Galendromus occidentalis]|uniref:Uncharacterized protein LOC108864464 n=1 Tax=Galendromus occidentalis TaxID=34638 RepID=A0AAJ7L6X9_9ACAR|nr:uncharacterized protein LOC108864464 [Galendromus occidentalis]
MTSETGATSPVGTLPTVMPPSRKRFTISVNLHRVRQSCTLQNAVLCIGILSIGLYVFEAVLFSTFVIYDAANPTGSPQDSWALSVSVMQVVQGVIGAVLSVCLLHGTIKEEGRFVFAWLLCTGLGVAFLFKSCVIETLAITAQGAEGKIDALTKIAVKCLILFIEMFFFIVVHAYYVRLRQEQDPPPYDTIA